MFFDDADGMRDRSGRLPGDRAVSSLQLLAKIRISKAAPLDRSSGFVPLKRQSCKTIRNVGGFVMSRYGDHGEFLIAKVFLISSVQRLDYR